MPSQLFKQTVPIEILFNLLSEVCETEHSYYKFNSDAYKRANMDNKIQPFLETLKPYYHVAKRKYVDRKQSYSKICYNKSKYEIIYYINKQSQLDVTA